MPALSDVPRARVWRRAAAPLLAALSLAALYGPSLRAHVASSAVRYSDDACQHVAPFLRPLGPDARDYTERYWRACLPLGYRAFYSLAGRVADPLAISRWLPYALLLLAAAGVAWGAAACGGTAGAWAAVACLLSADLFLANIAGGLPRSFAFPLLAWAAAAALRGRLRLLAVLVCVAAAFYPVIAVCTGLTLAVLLLLGPRADRGEASTWSWRRRLTVVALTGAITVSLSLTTLVAAAPYGPALRPADIVRFPEAGGGGRLGKSDQVAYAEPLRTGIRTFARLAFVNRGAPWWPVATPRSQQTRSVLLGLLAALAVLGALDRLRRDGGARRLLLLSACAAIGYLAARRFTPLLFLPQRHLAYPFPLLAILWGVVGLSALPTLVTARMKNPPSVVAVARWRAVTLLLGATATLLLSGGRIRPAAGLNADRRRGEALYTWLATLPEHAWIAGWPNVMAPVPLLCRRPVWLSYETHLPYHRRYTEEMRRRMRLLIDATFAASPEALLRLRAEGVTHLVVDRRLLSEPSPPLYFRPFTTWIHDSWSAGRAAGFELPRQPRSVAQVIGDSLVIDLARIQTR